MSFSVPIFENARDSASPALPLREILKAIVRREVDAYNRRHQERRLVEWLSEEAILDGVRNGKVGFGNREGNQADLEPCLRAVLDAVTDGLVLVFVDKHARTDLDETIPCRSDSRVMFVRIQTMRG